MTTSRLNAVAELFENGTLSPQVSTVLSLREARIAHERGKIVLNIAA